MTEQGRFRACHSEEPVTDVTGDVGIRHPPQAGYGLPRALRALAMTGGAGMRIAAALRGSQ